MQIYWYFYNIIVIFCLISECCGDEETITIPVNDDLEYETVTTNPTETKASTLVPEITPSTLENNASTTEIENATKTVNTTEAGENSANSTIKLVNCIPKLGTREVQLVNDTELITLLMPNPNITSKDTPANCLCVLFYSKHCPFSILAAPHFNALPRAFPDIKMVAINAIMYHIFNTQNGIVGVPSVLLLHNGKIIDKFNETDYTLEQFSKFITKNTGILAEEKSFVTSADFAGPVSSSLNKETDMLLVISWAFIISCAIYSFTRSKWWKWIIESVKYNWRESEAQAQHEHIE